jgi:MFS family permease
VPIGQAGTVYGLLLVVFGALGPWLGGWLAQRAALAGHADAELRVSLFATLGLLPLVAAAPFMPGLLSAALLLAPLVLLLSLPQGLAPAVLQLIAPNRLRAQVLSAFILCAVLAAYTVGPTAVPLFAQHVFGSEQALDRGLALLAAVLLPLAAAALQVARGPYREAMRAGGRGR